MPTGQGESSTVQELMETDGSERVRLLKNMGHAGPRKIARIGPYTPATEPMNKPQRVSSLHRAIAAVMPASQWVASVVGVNKVVGRDGTKIDVEVNAQEGDMGRELRLAEPLLCENDLILKRDQKSGVRLAASCAMLQRARRMAGSASSLSRHQGREATGIWRALGHGWCCLAWSWEAGTIKELILALSPEQENGTGTGSSPSEVEADNVTRKTRSSTFEADVFVQGSATYVERPHLPVC
ncbi:unnamed protein product [Symbiodinium natans]|uniref:Uncharacterized protein n=1 Tax=Symbiodinium natans TaxID=878477 RepID=A0A812RZC3_9DINO|nr:unnamed protein product [Symbiodinium natans]